MQATEISSYNSGTVCRADVMGGVGIVISTDPTSEQMEQLGGYYSVRP